MQSDALVTALDGPADDGEAGPATAAADEVGGALESDDEAPDASAAAGSNDADDWCGSLGH